MLKKIQYILVYMVLLKFHRGKKHDNNDVLYNLNLKVWFLKKHCFFKYVLGNEEGEFKTKKDFF